MKNKVAAELSIYVLFIVLILGTATSCKKFVQIPDAPDKLPTATVFSDSADAVAAVLGIYEVMAQSSTSFSFFYGGLTAYTGMGSDELIPTNKTGDFLQFYTNSINAVSNKTINPLWTKAYTVIYQVNACLEGVAQSSALSTYLKNELSSEARMVRAYAYFNLVNLYGSVPLVLTTDYRITATLPRSSVDSIYSQIISDLKLANEDLSDDYPSAGRVRPNKMTALAFLAKVFLYRKQWSDAENASSQVIASGKYNLESDLKSVFLAQSNEAIWQLLPVQTGFETVEGYNFVPTSKSVIPKYSINRALLDSFEINDNRRSSWLDSNVVNKQAYYYPKKYKLGYDGNSSPVEYYMLFRLAEQYLIRAEARVEQNNLSGATDDINAIRSRAGLDVVSGGSQDDLRDQIYKERKSEMFCETGSRWFDLKRSGRIDGIMGKITPLKGGTWNTNWQLYAIPNQQIILNPFLTQNLGYN